MMVGQLVEGISGWMDGEMGEWMDGEMGGRMEGGMGGLVEERIKRYVDG